MASLDRLGWTAGLAFQPFGLRLGVRTNDVGMLERVRRECLPADWLVTTDGPPEVDFLYSLYIGPSTQEQRTRNYHLLYASAQRVARTLDLDEAVRALRERLLDDLAWFCGKHVFLRGRLVDATLHLGDGAVLLDPEGRLVPIAPTRAEDPHWQPSTARLEGIAFPDGDSPKTPAEAALRLVPYAPQMRARAAEVLKALAALAFQVPVGTKEHDAAMTVNPLGPRLTPQTARPTSPQTPPDRVELQGQPPAEPLIPRPTRQPFPAYHSWSTWAEAREQLPLAPEALATLDRTWDYATTCHGDQTRPTGDPYPLHLLEVVEILVASGHTDTATLQAGMLHDVVEDTGHSLAEIRERFGEPVAELVGWMTKPEPQPGEDPKEVRKRYLAQFGTAPEKAVTVKLADRLSNVQRIHDYEKGRSYYRETVEHVMPHAHRVPWFAEKFRQWQQSYAYLA